MHRPAKKTENLIDVQYKRQLEEFHSLGLPPDDKKELREKLIRHPLKARIYEDLSKNVSGYIHDFNELKDSINDDTSYPELTETVIKLNSRFNDMAAKLSRSITPLHSTGFRYKPDDPTEEKNWKASVLNSINLISEQSQQLLNVTTALIHHCAGSELFQTSTTLTEKERTENAYLIYSESESSREQLIVQNSVCNEKIRLLTKELEDKKEENKQLKIKFKEYYSTTTSHIGSYYEDYNQNLITIADTIVAAKLLDIKIGKKILSDSFTNVFAAHYKFREFARVIINKEASFDSLDGIEAVKLLTEGELSTVKESQVEFQQFYHNIVKSISDIPTKLYKKIVTIKPDMFAIGPSNKSLSFIETAKLSKKIRISPEALQSRDLSFDEIATYYANFFEAYYTAGDFLYKFGLQSYYRITKIAQAIKEFERDVVDPLVSTPTSRNLRDIFGESIPSPANLKWTAGILEPTYEVGTVLTTDMIKKVNIYETALIKDIDFMRLYYIELNKTFNRIVDASRSMQDTAIAFINSIRDTEEIIQTRLGTFHINVKISDFEEKFKIAELEHITVEGDTRETEKYYVQNILKQFLWNKVLGEIKIASEKGGTMRNLMFTPAVLQTVYSYWKDSIMSSYVRLEGAIEPHFAVTAHLFDWAMELLITSTTTPEFGPTKTAKIQRTDILTETHSSGVWYDENDFVGGLRSFRRAEVERKEYDFYEFFTFKPTSKMYMFTECLKFVASRYYLYPDRVQRDPWYFSRQETINTFQITVENYRNVLKGTLPPAFTKVGDERDVCAMIMSDVWML